MPAPRPPADPVFFAGPEAFRAWLEANHALAGELWVGYWKKGTARPSLTWPESVDQALCFGWIDGVRRSLGPDSYVIRFTPRRPDSIWSEVNIRRARALIETGLMRPAGLAAFEGHEARTNRYSYEREHAALTAEEERTFRANGQAWEFFQAQAPSYRKTVLHWITSAKRAETRAQRLETLVGESAAGRRIDFMRPPGRGAQ